MSLSEITSIGQSFQSCSQHTIRSHSFGSFLCVTKFLLFDCERSVDIGQL
jgi:hypothetical protein